MMYSLNPGAQDPGFFYDPEPYAISGGVDRLSTIWMTDEEPDRLDAGQRHIFVGQKANLTAHLPVRDAEDIDELQPLAAPEYHRKSLPAGRS